MVKLQTNRLNLKAIVKDDYHFIRFFLSDPARTQFLPLKRPYSEKETRAWVTTRLAHWEINHFGIFIIQEKESKKTIGYCGLERVRETEFIDIRYGLIQEVWGQGIAIEAAFCCLNYGFEVLELEMIYGAAVPENHPSVHILKRLGMTSDRSFNCYGDLVDPYSICKDEFKL